MVLHALLAAGVIPVFVDIDPTTGNIDPGLLRRRTLSSARGLVTTNLYGVPDLLPELVVLAEKQDLTLIEDCAHVVDATFGSTRVGTFGDAAVFSFSKVLGAKGGFVLCRDLRLAQSLRAQVRADARAPRLLDSVVSQLVASLPEAGRSLLRRTVAPALRRPAESRERLLAWLEASRRRPQQARRAAAEAADPFDALGSDGRDFDVLPARAALHELEHRLASMQDLVAQRRERNQNMLDSCVLARPVPEIAATYCHLVVPFFTPRRDELVRGLMRRGVRVQYIYDPPRSELFARSPCVDAQVEPARARLWSRTVLPVDARHADTLLAFLRDLSAQGRERVT
jgi:dTDP-4-amino-4,6-dideoxygalactose transaminase